MVVSKKNRNVALDFLSLWSQNVFQGSKSENRSTILARKTEKERKNERKKERMKEKKKERKKKEKKKENIKKEKRKKEKIKKGKRKTVNSDKDKNTNNNRVSPFLGVHVVMEDAP